MLTEYALTPELFDDEHNASDSMWTEQLREFGNRLLPVDRNQVFNAVIANLYGGSWYNSGFQLVIHNLESRQKATPGQKLPALDLLKTLQKRIDPFLVTRPCCNEEYPDNEEKWVNEAISSARTSGVPLHKIITSSQRDSDSFSYQLNELWKADFWSVTPLTQCPGPNMGDQIDRFSHTCTFYDFIAFCSPQLDIHGSKDLDFTIALIKQSLHRPTGFNPLMRVDLHTKADIDTASRTHLANRIRIKVQSEINRPNVHVYLFLWPKILERRLLSGFERGAGNPKIVWSYSLSHVLRPQADGPDQEEMTFSILPPIQTSKLVSRYYGRTNQPFPESPIQLL